MAKNQRKIADEFVKKASTRKGNWQNSANSPAWCVQHAAIPGIYAPAVSRLDGVGFSVNLCRLVRAKAAPACTDAHESWVPAGAF